MKRRVLLIVGGLFLGLVLVLGASFRPLVRWAMTPKGPFDAAKVPRAPDYADPASWTALPGQVLSAEVSLPSLPAVDPARAAADVFYVHPTTYVGGSWNGPVDDAALNAATDKVATRLQASAFNACCAVYGPRYRQSNGTAFTHPTPDGQRAMEVAYRDVAEAFRYYLAHYNRGRPFILASHSQGSVMAQRLLREEIAGSALRERLVAAYLGGFPLTADRSGVPACSKPEQTGCVVVWNARGPQYQPGLFEFRSLEGSADTGSARLCTNPLTWRADEAPAQDSQNPGALFWEQSSPRVIPAFASAQCKDGTLVVAQIQNPPRDLMSRLLDYSLGAGNYHPIEYQIFYVSLRQNAQARVSAFLSRTAPQK